MSLKIKNIFWDFDGVIVDSLRLKGDAFRSAFEDFPEEMLVQLTRYHYENPGVSRRKKIEYFFEKIALVESTQTTKDKRAKLFSQYVVEKMSSPSLLIDDSVNFIRKNAPNYNFHIVSASDQNELVDLCNKLEIGQFFRSIHGAPAAKAAIVDRLMRKNRYKKEQSALIGDSIVDLEAAKINGINFFGFNSVALKKTHELYIESFSNFLE